MQQVFHQVEDWTVNLPKNPIKPFLSLNDITLNFAWGYALTSKASHHFPCHHKEQFLKNKTKENKKKKHLSSSSTAVIKHAKSAGVSNT